MLKLLPILCCLLLQSAFLAGQCPDRQALWKHLEQLLVPPLPSGNDELKELLPVLKNMKKCHYENDSTYVFLLQRIGIAYHRTYDDENAYRYTRASISVIAANAGTGRIRADQPMRSYFNLAEICDSLKLIPERNNAQDSFINLALKIHFNRHQLYEILANRIAWCFHAGDYQQCISYGSIPDLLPYNPDTIVSNRKDNILGYRLNALLALKMYDSAKKILAANLVIARAARNTDILGTLYGIAGSIARDQKDLSLALADFHQEFNYFRIIRDNTGCNESLNAIGYLYFDKRQDSRNALRYYRQALFYEDATETISTYDNIALLFAVKRQYDSALFYFQQAFNQISPGIDETSLLQGSITQTINNLVEYVSTLVLDKGDIFLQKYQDTRDTAALRQALLVYKAADRLLNRLKSEQTDFTSRLFWRTNSHRLYEHAITAAWQQGDPNTIFYFLEKSRAVLLNDQVNLQRRAGNDDILKEAQLKKNILSLEKERESNPGDPATNLKIQSDLLSAQQALTGTEQSIKQRNPLYYQHFLDTTTITLKDLRKYLDDNHQTMLQLYSGDTAIYAMLITPGRSWLNRINKADYDSTAKAYMSYLSDPDLLNRDMPGYIRTAYHLYRLLFPDQTPPKGRIIISTDGNYFPFESLVTGNSTQNPAWFLYDHPTCYTYSGAYLLLTATTDSTTANTNSPSPDKDFLGIAPVQYAAYQHLAALQGSDQSLDRISANFGSSDQFLSGQASRNNFLHNFSRYRLIQLYTHAIGNSGKEPIIYFADSALALSELISENKPAARLIVLSACESGNGQFYQGEGTFSFNREFAALGIPASIINRWSVDNKATYRLTELFYKYLSAGDPADLALQKAKLEFLQQASGRQRLPYYWAAPLLTGSAAGIGQKPPHRLITELIISLTLLLVVIISYLTRGSYLRRHRRRQAHLSPYSR